MNDKVSIIIPTFNRAHLITDAIESVLNQTYTDWECIIIDDGSTDDTEKIIIEYSQKDNRFRYLKRPKSSKKGANVCRNIGIVTSTGDYLLFLDSDDILSPNCLEQRVAFLKQNPDIDFALFSMGLLRGITKEHYNYPDLSSFDRHKILQLFLTGPLPWNMTRPIWKKSSFDRLGFYFNEDLSLLDDDEFNIKVVHSTILKFKFSPISDCYYRIYEENSSKYEDNDYIKKLISSNLILYKTFDILFSDEEKVLFKNELQYKIIKLLNNFVLKDKIHRKQFTEDLGFYYNRFFFSWKTKLLIRLKLLFGYNLHKKGKYRFNKFLNSMLFSSIEK